MRWLVLLSLFACAHPPIARTENDLPQLTLSPLTAGVSLHRSWHRLPEGLFSANGLLTSHGLLIDTAWSAAQTEELYRRALAQGITIRDVVVTHAHEDRVIGLEVLAQHGVHSHGLERTRKEAKKRELPAPSQALPEDGALQLDGEPIEVFFPGQAHATDNLVVFLPSQRVLFGGCLVRALDAGLGPLTDANLARWRLAIEAVDKRYGDRALIVVPGHGEPGGRELLIHTRQLVDQALAESRR